MPDLSDADAAVRGPEPRQDDLPRHPDATTARHVILSGPDPATLAAVGFGFARRLHRSFHDLVTTEDLPSRPDAVSPEPGRSGHLVHRDGPAGGRRRDRPAFAAERLGRLLQPSTPLVVAAPPEALEACCDRAAGDADGSGPTGAGGPLDVVVLWLVDGDDTSVGRDAPVTDVSVPLRTVSIASTTESTIGALSEALATTDRRDPETSSPERAGRGPRPEDSTT